MKNLFKHSIVTFNSNMKEAYEVMRVIDQVLIKYERDKKVSHIMINETLGKNDSDEVEFVLECGPITWMNIKNDLETVRLATGMNIVKYDKVIINKSPKGTYDKMIAYHE